MEQRPYRPSNGTEGECFIDTYCMNCINCDPNPDGKKQCEILCASLWFNINEEGYPKEWIYNEQNKPTCTSWVKWDWGTDGNPDDRDNPKAPIPDDPNQLMLPFIFDELGIKEPQKQLAQ